jgi:hypothetical protein
MPIVNGQVEALTPSGQRIRAGAEMLRAPSRVRSDRTTYPLNARTNERGFFQIPLTAGDYLVALRDGSATATATVRVLDGAETRLPEFLVPAAALAIDITVDPPAAPNEERWELRLSRQHPFPMSLPALVVPFEGTARVSVTPGVYSVELWSGDDRWFYQPVSVEESPGPVLVRIPFVRVRGRLSMGGRPLEGLLVFGGQPGSPRHVTLKTDEEGLFAGAIPKAGLWQIGVSASAPRVSRRVMRAIPDSADVVDVDIDIPAAVLRGRVLTPERRPSSALVAIYTADPKERLQVPTDPSTGEFDAAGLPAGRVQFEAEGEGLSTGLIQTVLTDGENERVDAILRPMDRLRGEVQSPNWVCHSRGRGQVAARPGVGAYDPDGS